MRPFKSSDISIVIPTYNAAKTITPLLESVFSQAPLPGEVIIADDASSDGTIDIAKKFPVTVLAQPKNGGAAKCRNMGLRESKGEVILFLDSDTFLLPGAIASVVDGFNKNENVHAMNGYCHHKPLNRGWAVLYKGLVENSWGEDIKEGDDTSRCINARIGAFTKASLLDIGGFDETYRGASVEDHELGIRYSNKYRIYCNKKMMVMHHFPNFSKTVRNYWNRTCETMKLIDRYKGVLDSGGVSRKSAMQYLLGGAALALFPIAFIMPFLWIPWAFLAVLYIFSIKRLLRRFFRNGPIFGIFCVVLHAFYGVVIMTAGIYYKSSTMIKKVFP